MKRYVFGILLTAMALLASTALAGGPVCYYPGTREGLTREENYREVLLLPPKVEEGKPIPWVLQLARPNRDIRAINTPLITNGVAVVLVDAMKLYGSPAGIAKLDALYETLTTKRGFAKRMTILTRDPNALLAYRWAIANPDKVNGIAALTPSTDLAAIDASLVAAAYGLSAEVFAGKLNELNPLNGLAPLAKAGIEIFHIHPESDKRCPIETHSKALEKRYTALGGTMILKTIEGGDMKSLLVFNDEYGVHGLKGLIKDEALSSFLEKHVAAQRK